MDPPGGLCPRTPPIAVAEHKVLDAALWVSVGASRGQEVLPYVQGPDAPALPWTAHAPIALDHVNQFLASGPGPAAGAVGSAVAFQETAAHAPTVP